MYTIWIKHLHGGLHSSRVYPSSSSDHEHRFTRRRNWPRGGPARVHGGQPGPIAESTNGRPLSGGKEDTSLLVTGGTMDVFRRCFPFFWWFGGCSHGLWLQRWMSCSARKWLRHAEVRRFGPSKMEEIWVTGPETTCFGVQKPISKFRVLY